MNNNNKKSTGELATPPQSLQESPGSVGIEAFAIDTNNSNNDGGSEKSERPIPNFEKGQLQPKQYNDAFFSIAFCIQFAGIATVPMWFGVPVPTLISGDEDFGEFIQYISFLFIGCCLFIMSALSLMTKFPHSVVMIAFVCSPVTIVVAAVLIFVFDPNHLSGIDANPILFILLFGFIISVMIVSLYYLCVKRRIPLAAAILHTALVAIGSNTGLYLISSLISIVLFLWVMIWFVAMQSILAKGEVKCVSLYPNAMGFNEDDMCVVDDPNSFTIILMILGLFWTQQVLQNILHTTTAGSIGTWCVTPTNQYNTSRGEIISKPIKDSFKRTVSYSFGSICLGSLLVAMIKPLESIARVARNNRDSRNGGALLLCVPQCLLRLLRNIVEYINSWAFVYVGLYGYDYLTSGPRVIRLFQSRPGWTTFISDRLVFRVLLLFHLCIAIFTGFLAIMQTKLMLPETMVGVEAAAITQSFMMGFIIGGLISSTVLSVVESSVRTVMVCFIESPEEFQEYHPEVYDKNIHGWKQTYPDPVEYLF